jgi:pSer/pThr/pTyr-binding forkhead associated (FHA) protein
MRDGLTEKGPSSRGNSTGSPFLGQFRARLVVLSGGRRGEEISLTGPCITLGRGPGVDHAFEDAQMSRQHIALDLEPAGYRVRDLGSTNGLSINGNTTQSGLLSHGDRLQIGELTLQYVVEERAGSGSAQRSSESQDSQPQGSAPR